MKKKFIIASLGMCTLFTAHAQQQDTTLVRTVVVENEYNPTVMDASKINVLPKVEEPTVPKTHIDYSTSIRPVTGWIYQAMSPIVKDWKADTAYRGYLRAGYGNNGNVDARLGYLWNITKKDWLNLAASFGGWNGELPLIDADWSSRFYNTKIGLDYKHSFKKMDLVLGGDYNSKVFNYIGGSNTDEYSNKQHQTLANAYLGIASNDKDMPIQFLVKAGMKMFDEKYPAMYHNCKDKETNLYLEGDVWKQSIHDNRYGLKVRFDNYSYSADVIEDWSMLAFNPYFSTQNDDWKVRIGAHIDWKGGENEKVYVSPDVKVEYLFADSYVLFAQAEGGCQASGFYELSEITPYFIFKGNYIKPTYVTLDAALGLKASPANGWWFLVSGGYQIRENDVCWTLALSNPFWCAHNIYGNTKVFYGTVELKYDYKDLFDFFLKGTYYNWKWENSDWAGAGNLPLSLKPELEVGAEVGFKPVQGLRVNLGYEYLKRCNDGCGDPVSNLYVGADYALLKNLNVFAKFNNLLNKEYVASYAYPAQKLNFLAGLSLQF